jgi:hypothetical protein
MIGLRGVARTQWQEMFTNVPRRLEETVKNIVQRGEKKYAIAAGWVIAEYLDRNFGESGVGNFVEFQPDEEGNISYRYSARLISIGDTLFLLRSCPGFAEFCRRLKGRDLRSTFFEVFAARLFFGAGFEINARPESGVKGMDFDFEAFRSGQIVNVEVTALTVEKFSTNTIENALETKRKQLSRNIPSIIFCVYPESWVCDNIGDAFESITTKFFARSKRVNAVIFLTEQHIDHLLDGRRGLLRFPMSVHSNPSPRISINLDFLVAGGSFVKMGPKDGSVLIDAFRVWRDTQFFHWVDYLLPETSS